VNFGFSKSFPSYKRAEDTQTDGRQTDGRSSRIKMRLLEAGHIKRHQLNV